MNTYFKVAVFSLVVLSQLLGFAHAYRRRSQREINDVSCSDNATCIQKLADELAKGVKENKTLKVFNMVTIEPISPVVNQDGRSNEGSMARFFNTHAIKVDFGRIGVRVMRSAKQGASMELEVDYDEGRSVQDGGRSRNKRLLAVVLPLLLGVTTLSTLMVATAAVTLLTFKAFLASKFAILVTITMAVKKLMETFSGFGIQHHPYLYNQYPVDFSGAASGVPAYAMPAGTAYAAPDVFGISGSHNHEMLQSSPVVEQSHDVSAQYSQPQVVQVDVQGGNVTGPVYASSKTSSVKRWDGLKKKPMYYERPLESYSPYQDYEK